MINVGMKIARVYQRVSTKEQDLTRQNKIIAEAQKNGFYVAGVYREKASGARTDRPELQRMISDLQCGEVVVAERMDRISRLPLDEAEALIDAIKAKGARLAIPGIVDFTEVIEGTAGVTKIVLEELQRMLLRLALQMARDEYEDRRERQRQGIERGKANGIYQGRKPDKKMQARVIAFRQAGKSISETSELAGCSTSTVKRIWSDFVRTKKELDIIP